MSLFWVEQRHRYTKERGQQRQASEGRQNVTHPRRLEPNAAIKSDTFLQLLNCLHSSYRPQQTTNISSTLMESENRRSPCYAAVCLSLVVVRNQGWNHNLKPKLVNRIALVLIRSTWSWLVTCISFSCVMLGAKNTIVANKLASITKNNARWATITPVPLATTATTSS